MNSESRARNHFVFLSDLLHSLLLCCFQTLYGLFVCFLIHLLFAIKAWSSRNLKIVFQSFINILSSLKIKIFKVTNLVGKNKTK